MKISGRMAERWLWYAFLVTFAWQTRLIFWHADTVFNEWRSASLYLTDVLMAVLFVSALIGVRGRIRIRTTTADIVLALFFFTAVLSLVHARALTVGVVQLIRLVQ